MHGQKSCFSLSVDGVLFECMIECFFYDVYHSKLPFPLYIADVWPPVE